MNKRFSSQSMLLLVFVLLLGVVSQAQTTQFTYQGSLNDNSQPADGNYDFEFVLFDSLNGGLQIGSTITKTNVAVSDGVFSVSLDFGSEFPGSGRFLELRVAQTGAVAAGGFTSLAPRQTVNSSPYSIKSLNASTADNANQLGGVNANQFVITTDTRLSDARPPTSGSSNYIQNTTQQQTGDFDISGTGKAVILDATTQFNLGGSRILSKPGVNNLFAGIDAGLSNTTGGSNSFFGQDTGKQNTTGQFNSFFGTRAGESNQNGAINSFFGEVAGRFNTSGSDNSFFGAGAGLNNTDGSQNSFFGRLAGSTSASGVQNTSLGFRAEIGINNLMNATAIGARSQVNTSNSLVLGSINGINGASNDTNVGIGTTSPTKRLHVAVNSGQILFGDAGCNPPFTGIGFGSTMSGCSNFALLGDGNDTIINRPTGQKISFRVNGTNEQMALNPGGTLRLVTLGSTGATTLCRNASLEISTCPSANTLFIQNTTTQQTQSNFNISGTGKADSFEAATQYDIAGRRVLSIPGGNNVFVGKFAGAVNTTGIQNSFFGDSAGSSNLVGQVNSFFGAFSGSGNTSGVSNSFFGGFAGSSNVDGSRNSFFGKTTGLNNLSGNENAFFGTSAGNNNTSGSRNSFYGTAAGFLSTEGVENSFFGKDAGISNTVGSRNTILGYQADVGSNNLTNANAIGFRALVGTSNSLVLGSISGVNLASADTNVGIGTTSPTERLHIAVNSGQLLIGDIGCPSDFVGIGFGTTLSGCTNYAMTGMGTNTFINRPAGGSLFFREGNVTQMEINSGGVVSIEILGSGGTTQLCRNASNEISTCSSSIKYKSNIQDFRSGLDLIKKLRPVSFNWRDGGMLDVGLVAEEVAEVEPLLTTTKDGRVEGVKYDRVGVVLVNAVVELDAKLVSEKQKVSQQKEEIDELTEKVRSEKEKMEALTRRLKALEAIVCELKPEVAGCKSIDD